MKNSIKILLFSFAGLLAFTALGSFDVINLPEWFANSNVITAGMLASAGYIDSQGNWIASGRGASSDPQAVNTLIGGMTQCSPRGNYTFPDQVTFVADNSAGLVAVQFKFTQADDMTEAIDGSKGTKWFDIQELPFGDGSIPRQDGTDIFGAASLASALQTYGMKIGKIQASGTAIANTTSLIIDNWRTNLTGPEGDKWKLEIDTQNAQSAGYTLQLVKDIDLTSNMTFRCSVPAGTILQLTFFNKGVLIYT